MRQRHAMEMKMTKMITEDMVHMKRSVKKKQEDEDHEEQQMKSKGIKTH